MGDGPDAAADRETGGPSDTSPGRLVRSIRMPRAASLQLRSRQCASIRAGNLRGGREPLVIGPLARFRAMGRRLSVPRLGCPAVASAIDLLAVLSGLRGLLFHKVRQAGLLDANRHYLRRSGARAAAG